jgi:hypothetical protein
VFFLLTGLLLAWQSGRRASVRLAALAGLTGGVMLIYQEIYVVMLPLLGLAVFASPGGTTLAASSWRGRSVDRPALLRYIVFGAGCSVGLLAFVAFNSWRFGTLMAPSRYDNPLMFAGNPVAGLLSLAVSPGKSIILFSPPVILAIIGARGLFKRAPVLVAAVGLISLIHVLLVIQLPFFGGDWCWGPRYLLVLLPLWALAFPFATQVLGRRVVGIIVTLGLVVQLMGISIDHQRFFLERDFRPYFWLDPWVYFKHSQLFARAQELFVLVRDGVPVDATLPRRRSRTRRRVRRRTAVPASGCGSSWFSTRSVRGQCGSTVLMPSAGRSSHGPCCGGVARCSPGVWRS